MCNNIWTLDDYLKFLKHKNLLVRKWALENLKTHYPGKATKEVVELLNDDEIDVAVEAAEYLAYSGDKTVWRVLITAFEKGESDLPRAVLKALAQLECEDAVPVLADYLSECSDPVLYEGLCNAIAACDGKNARKILISQVNSETDLYRWSTAAKSLLYCSEPEDIALLIRHYLSASPLSGDEKNYRLMALQVGVNTLEWFQICKGKKYSFSEKVDCLLSAAGLGKESVLNNEEIVENIEKYYNAADLNSAAVEIYSAARRILIDCGVSLKDWPEKVFTSSNQDSDLRLYCRRWLVIENFMKQSEKKRPGISKEQIRDEIVYLLCCLVGLEMYDNYDEKLSALSGDALESFLLKRVVNGWQEIPDAVSEELIAGGEKVALKLAQNINRSPKGWGPINAVRLLAEMARLFPESTRVAIPALFTALEEEGDFLLKEEAIKALSVIGPPVLSELKARYEKKEIDGISLLSILGSLPYEDAALFIYKHRHELFLEDQELFLNVVFNFGHEIFIDFLQKEWRPGEFLITKTLLLLCELHQKNIPQLPDVRREHLEHLVEMNFHRQKFQLDKGLLEEDIPLRLKLNCNECGRIYTYRFDIEDIILNVAAMREKNTENIFYINEDVRCKKCGAVNRLEFTTEARLAVMFKLLPVMEAIKNGNSVENVRCPVIETGVLDNGTVVQSLQEAEEYYANRVREEPKNAKLRVYYGNVLRKNGRIKEAVEQYSRACDLDYRQIEARFSLLTLYNIMEEEKKAVDAGLEMLDIAYSEEYLTDDEKDMVLNGLEIMKELAPDVIRDRGYLKTTMPWNAEGTYRRIGPKIGRNDPCPCGSGKKYKKCCGR